LLPKGLKGICTNAGNIKVSRAVLSSSPPSPFDQQPNQPRSTSQLDSKWKGNVFFGILLNELKYRLGETLGRRIVPPNVHYFRPLLFPCIYTRTTSSIKSSFSLLSTEKLRSADAGNPHSASFCLVFTDDI
jgi:hypothetical protein